MDVSNCGEVHAFLLKNKFGLTLTGRLIRQERTTRLGIPLPSAVVTSCSHKACSWQSIFCPSMTICPCLTHLWATQRTIHVLLPNWRSVWLATAQICLILVRQLRCECPKNNSSFQCSARNGSAIETWFQGAIKSSRRKCHEIDLLVPLIFNTLFLDNHHREKD